MAMLRKSLDTPRRKVFLYTVSGRKPFKLNFFCSKTTHLTLNLYSVTMIFPFLSFLAVGTSSAQVITWLANLTEAAQIIDYIAMCIIYLFFYRALKAQGFNRSDLPYKGKRSFSLQQLQLSNRVQAGGKHTAPILDLLL
jgi:hypothetical protein